ncbi:hypothetical protein [Streptomyces sp. NPDC054842]
MWPDEGEPSSDICAQCGVPLGPNEGRIVGVPDSSFVSPLTPQLDGKRILLVCSAEHGQLMYEEYQRRPFIEEQLWEIRLTQGMRTIDLRQWPDGVTAEALAQASGLTPEQVERAVMWRAKMRQTFRPDDG